VSDELNPLCPAYYGACAYTLLDPDTGDYGYQYFSGARVSEGVYDPNQAAFERAKVEYDANADAGAEYRQFWRVPPSPSFAAVTDRWAEWCELEDTHPPADWPPTETDPHLQYALYGTAVVHWLWVVAVLQTSHFPHAMRAVCNENVLGCEVAADVPTDTVAVVVSGVPARQVALSSTASVVKLMNDGTGACAWPAAPPWVGG
jgi:hypothetical protein